MAPQRPIRACNIALGKSGADVGGADALAFVVKQGHDINAEAELGAKFRQRLRGAGRTRAEREVLPHHDVFCVQAPHKEVCHVLARPNTS